MSALIPIGGNINWKNPVVVREFTERAGGKAARIVILPQASADDDTGEFYIQKFRDLGVRHARSLDFKTRAEAGTKSQRAALRAATGIFIAGGFQLRLTSLYGGTTLLPAIQQAFARGAVVAGTSAGAAVMSTTMFAYGKGGQTPRDKIAQFVPGFALTKNFIVDQRFRQRDRLGRLIYIIAAHPGPIGLGVDEDTAAIIEDDARVTVAGSGGVTIVDGREMQAADIAEIEDGGPIAVSGVRIHVLTPGCKFNARTRKVFIPRKAKLND
ncbi:MAG: cyanophycinase [Chloroflexota bacterium]